MCLTQSAAINAQQPASTDSLRGAIARETKLGRARELASAWNSLGHQLFDAGHPDSALHAYRQAQRIRLSSGDAPGAAGATNNIALAFAALAQLDSAIAYYRRSIAMRERLDDNAGKLIPLKNLGITYGDSAAQNRSHGDSAIAVFRRALVLARSLGHAEAVPDILEWIGIVEYDLGQPHAAIATWHAAITSVGSQKSTSRADMYGRIAAAFRELELADSAAVYFRAASEEYVRTDEPGKAAQEILTLGDVHAVIGAVDSSITAYARAYRLYHEARDSAGMTYALLRLGNRYQWLGALDSAAHFLHRGLLIGRASANADALATALRQFAAYHESRGSADSARVLLAEAGALLEGRDVDAETDVLLDLADIDFSQRRFADATTTYHRALSLARARGSRGAEAAALGRISGYYLGLVGRQDSAAHYARRALKVNRDIKDSRAQALNLIALGRTSQHQDSSRQYFSEAVAIAQRIGNRSVEFDANYHWSLNLTAAGLVEEGATRARLARENARMRNDPLHEANALSALARSYGNGRSNFAPPDPRAPQWRVAAAYYDTAWTILERVRLTTVGERARIQFANEHINAARLLSDALKKDAAATGSQQSLRLALAAAERGRAQALADAMRGPANPAAMSLEKQAAAFVKLLGKPGQAGIIYLQGSPALFITLVLPDGKIIDTQVDVSEDSMAALVGRARSSLDVESAAAYAMQSRDPVIAGRRGASNERGSVNAALAALSRVLLPAELTSALRLANVTDVVIIPSAELTLVPFAALPFGDDAAPTGVQLRIRYAPSLSVLAAAEARATSAGNRDWKLVVGNPVMPAVPELRGDSTPLSALPGAEREAARVARELDTPVVIGAQATETYVKQNITSADVLHLATHGYAYATAIQARSSFIALAPDTHNDGLLTVGEVLDGPMMRADLVVLSACQTALGNTTHAEGTVGLHWAFLAKGARSLLVSLWSVDDKVTERLMTRFYEHWTSGTTKAEALRRAQEEIRRDHPNPRYWAAFQLVGAN